MAPKTVSGNKGNFMGMVIMGKVLTSRFRCPFIFIAPDFYFPCSVRTIDMFFAATYQWPVRIWTVGFGEDFLRALNEIGSGFG